MDPVTQKNERKLTLFQRARKHLIKIVFAVALGFIGLFTAVDISDLAPKFAEETNERIITGEMQLLVDSADWQFEGSVKNP